MILGRVIGSVVSTIHHRVVENKKLLVAERLDATGKPTGGYLIALDAIGAGRYLSVSQDSPVTLDGPVGAASCRDNRLKGINAVNP